MEVILIKDMENLGYANDIVNVKPGYANNYLIPQGYAKAATAAAKKILAENLKQRAHKDAKILADAQALAETIANLPLSLSVKAEEGKLFGTVTAADLAEALAAKGITLDIKEGEFVSLTGASGSGKSTLMNILGCLDRPTSGHYYIAGEDVAKFNAAERATLRNKRIGFVFQNFNLLSRTTALENVMMPAVYAHPTLSMKAMRERSVELLNLVGLSDRMDHTPAQLSGGQQQRVAIARSLINNPSILLADEPTGNLDSTTSKEVLHMFKDLNRRQGITVILVTHDPKIAAFTDRAINMADGLICEGISDTLSKDDV